MARILYFAYLVDKLGRAQEDMALPATVQDVRGLLAQLRARGRCVGARADRGQGAGFGEQTVFHAGHNNLRYRRGSNRLKQSGLSREVIDTPAGQAKATASR